MARSKKVNSETLAPEMEATPAIPQDTTPAPAIPVADPTIYELTPGKYLEEKLAQYEFVSLRKLAISCDVTYGLVLKASKKPVPGTAYDPEATNWNEIALYFARRGVDLREIDWEALNEPTQRAGAAVTKSMDEWNVGDKVYLRTNATVPYDIVYKTPTHIVIQLEDTSEPQAWSHNTFLMKGPSKTARSIEAVAESSESNEEEV